MGIPGSASNETNVPANETLPFTAFTVPLHVRLPVSCDRTEDNQDITLYYAKHFAGGHTSFFLLPPFQKDIPRTAVVQKLKERFSIGTEEVSVYIDQGTTSDLTQPDANRDALVNRFNIEVLDELKRVFMTWSEEPCALIRSQLLPDASRLHVIAGGEQPANVQNQLYRQTQEVLVCDDQTSNQVLVYPPNVDATYYVDSKKTITRTMVRLAFENLGNTILHLEPIQLRDDSWEAAQLEDQKNEANAPVSLQTKYSSLELAKATSFLHPQDIVPGSDLPRRPDNQRPDAYAEARTIATGTKLVFPYLLAARGTLLNGLGSGLQLYAGQAASRTPRVIEKEFLNQQELMVFRSGNQAVRGRFRLHLQRSAPTDL